MGLLGSNTFCRSGRLSHIPSILPFPLSARYITNELPVTARRDRLDRDSTYALKCLQIVGRRLYPQWIWQSRVQLQGRGTAVTKRKARVLAFVTSGILFTAIFGLSGDDEGSLGLRFHLGTRHTPSDVLGSLLRFRAKPPLYKKYDSAEKVGLPDPAYRGMPVEEALRKRRSVRNYSREPIFLKELSLLLFAAQGITGRSGNLPLRTAPSAGALYPFEIYVVVNNVEDLDKGIYHYSILDHSLEVLRKGDYRREIVRAALDQDMVGKAGVTFVLAAIFRRTTWKYGDRGHRYVYMEAGHISQNIFLQATSLGLGSVGVGAFFDDRVNNLLGIDGRSEAAIYLHAVGKTRG